MAIETLLAPSRQVDSGWLGTIGHSVVADSEGNVTAIMRLPAVTNPSLLADHDHDPVKATHALAEKLSQRIPADGNWNPLGVKMLPDGHAEIRFHAPDVEILPGEKIGVQGARAPVWHFSKGGGYLQDNSWHALNEELRAGKLRPFTDAIAHAEQAFEHSGNGGEYKEWVEHLRAHPETAKHIEEELSKGGATSFRFLGHGRSGVFLESDNGLAIGVRSHIPDRPKIPQMIQPLHAFEHDGFGIEVMPRLDLSKADKESLGHVMDGVAQFKGPKGERFKVNDPMIRNIGHGAGIPYYLDGDGIEKVYDHAAASRRSVATTPVPHTWIEPDGTWSQYKAFEEHHRAFNSALHQGGGMLELPDLPPPTVEIPKAPVEGGPVPPWLRRASTPEQKSPRLT